MVLGASAYRQTATYWPPARQSGFGGQVFDAPQAIQVRWEQTIEIFVDRQGNEARSKAIVYSLTELSEQGYLMLGTSAAGDPTVIDNAWLIQRVDNIPDLRGLHNEYRNFL